VIFCWRADDGRLTLPLEFMAEELIRMPCPSCGQRIKFGVEDEGTDAFCPHCDTPVVLRSEGRADPEFAPPPPKPNRAVSKGVLFGVPAVVFCLVLGLMVTVAVKKQGRKSEVSAENTGDDDGGEEAPAKKGGGSSSGGGKKVAMLKGYKRPFQASKEEKLVFNNPTPRKAGEPTQLMGHKILDAKLGKMQYVVGLLKNHTGKRYFDVEIFFDLLDEKGKKIGEAKDYVGSLSGQETWEFKATIYNRGVASAVLRKVSLEAE
jgi:endogenous inhibitor of DNA gyrase (YacG/DUF329 family)